MEMLNVTTPFGRRRVTLTLVRRQAELANVPLGKVVDKWKIFRDASAARDLLGVQPNSLAVLNALLSFHPDNELRQDAQLIVFPSNIQLSLRAHGMAGATLRRHLAMLVEAGFILRKDSANGKRFARKNKSGEIESAFGFDLSPLLRRADEFALLAEQVLADRAALRKAKESLTICRRDVRKLITAAIEEGWAGDWAALEKAYLAAVAKIPRAMTANTAASALAEMESLKGKVINHMEALQISENNSTNDAQTERHIHNSKTKYPIESEGLTKDVAEGSAGSTNKATSHRSIFPLETILKACPTISDYVPLGGVKSWRDLMAAAVVVRSMLGVSPAVYQEACESLGPENAAVAMAYILERAHFISSPGAYLRDLTRRSERGAFSLGPMIVSLLRTNKSERLMTG